MGIANDVMESVKSAQKINESEDYLVTFGKDGKDEKTKTSMISSSVTSTILVRSTVRFTTRQKPKWIDG